MNTFSIATAILLLLQGAPAPQDQAPLKKQESESRTFFEYRNSAEGLTLKMDNGRVELTIPAEKGKSSADLKTYQAASLDEFKRTYPELVKKYDLDRVFPGATKPAAMAEWWKDETARLGGEDERVRKFLDDFPRDSADAFRDLDQWFDNEHRALRDLERRFHSEGLPMIGSVSPSHGAALGVLIMPVTDVLRTQLELAPGQGLLVGAVEKDSLAERSGLKQYDVLIKVDGQAVGDSGKFREKILSALKGGKDFEIDLIRGGCHQMVTIHPVAHS